MAKKVLDTLTLIAPASDPGLQEGQNFAMSMSFTISGIGGTPVVNLYWEYRYNGTFYAIPVSANGLYTDDNEQEVATAGIQYDRTIECNTQGAYYVRARAYDFDGLIEKISSEQAVTVTPGAAYLHGLKVQGVGELGLCAVGSHPLRIRKGGTTYGIELVDTGDGNASPIRIKTGAGVKALRKYT